MRVPAPPRLGQLAHIFPVNPTAAFGCKNMLASLRRHYHNRDPFGSPDTVLPSPTTTTTSSSTSSDVDPKFDTETVADDRTLVGSRRHSSSHSDEEDAITLSDVPEDEECAKSQFSSSSSRGPSTHCSTRDPSARRSIIYPLPSVENLLTHEPTTPPPATAIDSSVVPPLCAPALSPPPTHYKRRRARIISNEDRDPDLDQASIRFNSEPESTLRFPF